MHWPLLRPKLSEFLPDKYRSRNYKLKKVISPPVDIALQTVKNSGPSERNAVQDQICKYHCGTGSSFHANYPQKSLNGLTLTKPLRQFHDLQRNIHRLLGTTFVLVIDLKFNKTLTIIRIKFRCSGFSPAAGQKNGRSNRKRNFALASFIGRLQ